MGPDRIPEPSMTRMVGHPSVMVVVGLLALLTVALPTHGSAATGGGLRVGSAFTIADALAPANSDTTTPGRPAVGSDGANYLLVTCRSIGSPIGLVGVIVSSTGSLGQTFPIASHTCQSPDPVVAFDGTNYLVVFGRDSGIVGMRVSPSGGVLDGPNGF